MKTQQSSSQSLAVMEESSDSATAHATPHLTDQGLRAHFRHSRILGGVVLVIAAIAPIMLVLQGTGVTIESFLRGEKSDEQIKTLVDYYNSITGSLGSFVAKPVDLFVGLFMAAAFLCLATNFTLANTRVSHWKLLPLLTGAALAYLFSNGLNSLNVQVTPGELVTRIADEDLAAAQTVRNDQPPRDDGSLSTTWDKAYAESASGNSVLNTILRAKLLSQETLKSQCKGSGLDEVFSPLGAVPLVAFGFQSQPWQIETLATAGKPSSTLKVPLSIDSTSQLPVDSRLPSLANITSNLEIIATMLMGTLPLFDLPRYPNVVYFFSEANRSGTISLAETIDKWPPGADPDTHAYINASLGLWKYVLSHTVNASIEHASVDYNRIVLSDNIAFDAVTIELPIKKIQLSVTGVDPPKTVNYSMSLIDNCSREGCVTPKTTTPGYNTVKTIQPRVQVVSVCVSDDGTESMAMTSDKAAKSYAIACNRTSNNSMFVVSVGIRTDGDRWDLNTESFAYGEALFTNLRTVYSITVGRLSWKNEDLAQAFGAQCGSKNGCEGVRFKMQPNSSSSDYLVVGKSSLPLSELSPFDLSDPDGVKWRSLVSSADGLGEQGFDLLLPRRFSDVTANGTLQKHTSPENCSTFVDDFINMVEKNHLYMEQSLQTSYTAAFYFLFQNAVRRKSLNASSRLSSASPHLEFAGNQQFMNVQMSIPTTNAIISLAGCVVLLLTSFGVICQSKRSEHVLQELANAEIVAEAMMNSAKYPPQLLLMTLEQSACTNDDTDALQKNFKLPLQELRVQSVILEHSKEDSRRSFHIGSEVEV